MSLSFSASEARGLISEYKSLIGDLSLAVMRAESYPAEVSEAAQKLVVRDAYGALREVGVDALRKRIPRLRVKNLEDYGYHTIADVYAASVYSLRAVKGISEASAYAIKREAADMAADMRSGGKVRLSADDMTPDSTALVVALAKHRCAADPLRAARAADDPHARALAERAIEQLEQSSGFLGRLLTFGERKRAAEDAFGTLKAMVGGEWGRSMADAAGRLRTVEGMSEKEAWDGFRASPIGYTNALEALAPDLVGSADTFFGLPEDLAREVQDECFFPDGLLCELRRYQEWGVKYILHQGRVLLGDEMGLGKTVQAIATMVSLRNTGSTHFLVVCPASVLANWSREVRRHSKLSATELYGQGRQRAAEAWGRTGGVAVTTYETLSRIKLPESAPIGLLVVDEAHYVKNPGTRRGSAVRDLAARCESVLFMTGTPIENNVTEMESLIGVLRPEIAAKLSSMDSLPSAPRFREAVAPVYYRRKREEVLTELPELEDTREWCKMLPEETHRYEDMVRGRNFMAMRRVSWDVDRPEASSKATRLLELVDEAASEGRKVLVFSFFLDTVRFVMGALGTRALGPIAGAMPVAKRQELIDSFDEAPAGSVLVAQIQAGGTGLNIQSASVVVICEPQLKPSIEGQAISRAYRMGQARNVLVYHLLCEDSVDERIVDLLDEKQRVFDAFADKSVAAAQAVEVDSKSQSDLIEEEIERINRKNGAAGSTSDEIPAGGGAFVGDASAEGTAAVDDEEAAPAEPESEASAPSKRRPARFASAQAAPSHFSAPESPVAALAATPKADPGLHKGLSVTHRINGVPTLGIPAVVQPYGGYVSPRDFDSVALPGLRPLHDMKDENVNPGRVGTAVDYLARLVEGSPAEEAFFISLQGAAKVGEVDRCRHYLSRIRGTGDESIEAALCAVGYDAAFRAGGGAFRGVLVEPNAQTIENVREMVRRSHGFFAMYGPVVMDGLTFPGGYTDTVSAGDGDFLTADTLWDFKVSAKPPTTKHTLQVLMYWRLGVHSTRPEYGGVQNLGFFNPRLGMVYTLPVSRIPQSIIDEVERDVIGY